MPPSPVHKFAILSTPGTMPPYNKVQNCIVPSYQITFCHHTIQYKTLLDLHIKKHFKAHTDAHLFNFNIVRPTPHLLLHFYLSPKHVCLGMHTALWTLKLIKHVNCVEILNGRTSFNSKLADLESIIRLSSGAMLGLGTFSQTFLIIPWLRTEISQVFIRDLTKLELKVQWDILKKTRRIFGSMDPHLI